MPAVAGSGSKYLVMAGWNDVPHLSEKTKRELLESTPHHLRDARSKGVPLLGDGAIFPVADELIQCAPFIIPAHWRHIGGLDFGWDHPTAGVRLAYDPDADCVYVTHCYKQSRATVSTHYDALRVHGDWLPWAWPHDGDNDTAAGPALAGQYRDKGLHMLAERATWPEEDGGGNAVSPGLDDMLDRMNSGRWKVFSTCGGWMDEKRLYHRKDGKVVKKIDDAISASRYALMMLRFAVRAPQAITKKRRPGSWKTV